MHLELQNFFESYRAAFNALDSQAISALYAVPSGIATVAGYTHWPDFAAVNRNMELLCNDYRANGYEAAQFSENFTLLQSNEFAVVDLHWRIVRSQERKPWEFNTTYNLMRQNRLWKVLLATAYEEKSLRGAV